MKVIAMRDLQTHRTNAAPNPVPPGPAGKSVQIITAVSMTIGRGRLARAVAGAARLGPGDRVVDIGCGPGTAVRRAARVAAAAAGVDPSPLMLRLARWISRIRRSVNVSWLQGRAERLPLPDGEVSVAWAISSVHHWEDRAAGISEARRVLTPDGRLVVAERLARPEARGHAAHGLTRDQADDLAGQLAAAGFLEVRVETCRAGHRNLVIVQGRKGSAG
jgi:ubiquinone/menaquinone biosynthesis C-methylase UbiE